MVLDRPGAHDQAYCRFTVTEPVGDEIGNFALALVERSKGRGVIDQAGLRMQTRGNGERRAV